MTKDELFIRFVTLFPYWKSEVRSYKKIGSKCISIEFIDGTSKVFLYYSPDNWNFGTKLWRKKPQNKNGLAYDAMERSEVMGR